MNDLPEHARENQSFHSREIFEGQPISGVLNDRETYMLTESHEFSAIVARDCISAITSSTTDNISSVTV